MCVAAGASDTAKIGLRASSAVHMLANRNTASLTVQSKCIDQWHARLQCQNSGADKCTDWAHYPDAVTTRMVGEPFLGNSQKNSEKTPECEYENKQEEQPPSSEQTEYNFLVMRTGKALPNQVMWSPKAQAPRAPLEAINDRPRAPSRQDQMRVGLLKRKVARKVVLTGIGDLKDTVEEDAMHHTKASVLLDDFRAIKQQVNQNREFTDRKQLCRVVSFLRNHAAQA